MFYEITISLWYEDFSLATMRYYVLPALSSESAVRAVVAIWCEDTKASQITEACSCPEITVRPARLDCRRVQKKILDWIMNH